MGYHEIECIDQLEDKTTLYGSHQFIYKTISLNFYIKNQGYSPNISGLDHTDPFRLN